MESKVGLVTAALRDIIDALRRNNRLSHASILGFVVAILLGSITWHVVSLGVEAMAHIEQHGWQNAVDNLDNFTSRLWKGRGK